MKNHKRKSLKKMTAVTVDALLTVSLTEYTRRLPRLLLKWHRTKPSPNIKGTQLALEHLPLRHMMIAKTVDLLHSHCTRLRKMKKTTVTIKMLVCSVVQIMAKGQIRGLMTEVDLGWRTTGE
jgi:N-acyl-L-homoserine lactone synthetase